MAFPPEPADDVLLELGRLVWAAINLEDVVYGICRDIKPPRGQFDDEPISTRIREARSVLENADTLHQTADSWLAKAAAALDERNAVLHSIPVTFVPLAGTEPTPDVADQWLTHFPRDRKRPTVHTSLTTEGLRRTRLKLEEARLGWTDLAIEFSKRRRKRWDS